LIHFYKRSYNYCLAMPRKSGSSFSAPPVMDLPFITEITKAVQEDQNKNVTTFSPVSLSRVQREKIQGRSSEKDYHRNRTETTVKKSSTRGSGKYKKGHQLPPLPLESELFTPPVERGRRAERSISVLATAFLSMMPSMEKKEIMIRETANMMNTSIKRVYTICNVLEGLRLMERKGQNFYEWKGREELYPTLMLLLQMAQKDNVAEKIDQFSTSKDCRTEQSVTVADSKVIPEQIPTLNICMLTQKLMMLFLVLSEPKVITLPVATAVIHGVRVTDKQRTCNLQKLWDVSKILEEVGLIRKVKMRKGSERSVIAYQYVGEVVEEIVVENANVSVVNVADNVSCDKVKNEVSITVTCPSEERRGEDNELPKLRDVVSCEKVENESLTVSNGPSGSGEHQGEIKELQQSSQVEDFRSVRIKVEVDDSVEKSGEASAEAQEQGICIARLNSGRERISEEFSHSLKLKRMRFVLEDEMCMNAD